MAVTPLGRSDAIHCTGPALTAQTSMTVEGGFTNGRIILSTSRSAETGTASNTIFCAAVSSSEALTIRVERRPRRPRRGSQTKTVAERARISAARRPNLP